MSTRMSTGEYSSSDPMVMEATQIPQIGAVQEPDNVSNYDPSPKQPITAPWLFFKGVFLHLELSAD